MRRVALAIALAFTVSACASSSSGSSGSGVAGQTVTGSGCARASPLQRCRDHPVRATLVVMHGRSRKATIHSSATGRFRQALPAGTYRIVPQPRGDAMAPPRTVRVPSGGFVHVTIRYRASNR